MTIQPECIVCLLNQALRVCQACKIDTKATKEILERVAMMVPEWSLDETPPQIAARMYPVIAKMVGAKDPYREAKEISTCKAKELLPGAQREVVASQDRLVAALKAAIAGNVIDLGSQESFSIYEEIGKIFDTPLAIDHTKNLKEDLREAKILLYLGDNAGEQVFDRLLIETIRELYPAVMVFYAVRGRPIINDVTFGDALAAKLDEVATIIDSGVDTPSLDLLRASASFLKLYEKADLVISKGMGNYESLDWVDDKPIYFLFKVKCNVVASSIGKQVGDIICMKNLGYKTKAVNPICFGSA